MIVNMRRIDVMVFGVMVFGVMVFGLMTGCGGSGGQPSKTTPTVYVFGSVNTSSSDSYSSYASYLWINGTPTAFADKEHPNSVFGSKEGIVYIAGHEDTGDAPCATLWKIEGGKTSKIVLSDKHSHCESGFATEQGDVYVIGHDGEDWAVYWKVSGTTITKIPLSLTEGISDYETRSIWVAPNGKVYVAGSEGDFAEGDYNAVLWIDGEKQILPNNRSWSDAYAVYGNSNGDIYVVGEMYSSKVQAVLWKNNVIQYLAKEAKKSGASAIFVTDNGDVYVGGYVVEDDYEQAVIWKNGVKEYLPDGKEVKAIYVTQEGDVYAAGFAYEPASGLWKNGVLQPITHNSRKGASLYSIFVK